MRKLLAKCQSYKNEKRRIKNSLERRGYQICASKLLPFFFTYHLGWGVIVSPFSPVLSLCNVVLLMILFSF